MIVSITVQSLNGLGGVLFLVVVDEGEPLALVGLLVLGKVDTSDRAKMAEEILQIAFDHILREVGNPDRGSVLGCKEERVMFLKTNFFHMTTTTRSLMDKGHDIQGSLIKPYVVNQQGI